MGLIKNNFKTGDAAKVPYLGKVELDISNEEHCGLGLKSHQEIHTGTIIANYEGI
jgi:hypothetical protein